MSNKCKSGMEVALEENNEFLQNIRAHSCSTAADVLYGASQIGIIANQFAHEVGDEDPLREESAEVSAEILQLIQGKLLNKDMFAVANALFWHASAAAAAAIAECEDEENEENEEPPSEEEAMRTLQAMLNDQEFLDRIEATMGLRIRRVDADHTEIKLVKPN
jgi:hypothetical protein